MNRLPGGFNGVHATLIGSLNGCDWALERLQEDIDHHLQAAAKMLREKQDLVRQQAEIRAEINKGRWPVPEGFDKWGKPVSEPVDIRPDKP